MDRTGEEDPPIGREICQGPRVPPAPPHDATCCYPAMDLLRAPLRAAAPAFQGCFAARASGSARARVVLRFRIEQDGSVARACATADTTVRDAGAVACVLREVRRIRFSAMSDDERKLCGPVQLQYPVVFAREP